ncbi:MAG: threonine/serine dehydratase [Gemmatimonadota bacterium]
MLPTPAQVLAAAHRLRGVAERTALLRAPGLGTEVYLKCENLQRTGSFKLRGAYNALSSLSESERARGIVASSAGNHGLGVAWAAQRLGIRARIFVPASAPGVKRDGIRALGAQVDESQPHYDAAHGAAIEYSDAHEMPFVNPCSGAALIAGQGTVGVEILEDLPSVGTIVVPVGGGGLVGGIAAIVRAVAPHVRIVGAQTDVTNAMAASLAAGRQTDVEILPTLADGLAGQVDDEGVEIGRFAIDEMIVVSEEEVASAIGWLAHEHDMRAEGSGACAVAAMRCAACPEFVGPIAVIVSGGNIDQAVWRKIIEA